MSTADRNEQIFDAVASGKAVTLVAEEHGVCTAHVYALTYKVAKKRNPALYREMVVGNARNRTMKFIRTNAARFPKPTEGMPM